MRARGLWIVALGVALAVLIALNVFRSEQPGSADANVISRRATPGEDVPPAAQRPAEASTSQRADPTGVESHAPPQSQPEPAPIPASGLYPSMSAALADHDVPPERRMPVVPEMLETDRAFAAENVDPMWSTAAEAGVLGRIAEIPGAAYVSVNVECRTTLCLLQFVHSATPVPNSGIADVAKLVEGQGLKSLWMYGIRVRGGVPLGIAYLQRDDSAAAGTDGPEAR
jgi:hypothetical protein